MDSGWAVVIGAVLALVGSSFGPFLTERWKIRAQREDQALADRTARRRELGEILPKIAASMYQGSPTAEEMALIARVEFLLTAEEGPLANILWDAGTMGSGRDGTHVGAMVDSFGAWYRGSSTVEETIAAYQTAVIEGEAKDAADAVLLEGQA